LRKKNKVANEDKELEMKSIIQEGKERMERIRRKDYEEERMIRKGRKEEKA
jgi:hypothetical protein